MHYTNAHRRPLLAASLLAVATWTLSPLAQAGLFGALDDLASAAQDTGANVPNGVYAAGDVANALHNAAQSVTPGSQPATASRPAANVCPPGYTCTPQTPPPVCPPGETCTPDSVGTPSQPSTAQTWATDQSILQSQLGFSILPREQRHLHNPNYIQFVMPTKTFIAVNDPIIETITNSDSGGGVQFYLSRNNRQLPYLSPQDWQKYIVQTYRMWPAQAPIPTQSLMPGDPHGGLYAVSAARYRLVTQRSVSFFMGDAQGQAKIAEERAHGQKVPNLWVFLDPDCTLSHDFFLQAEKYADAGQIDIHTVVTGLDQGSPGRAEAILSSRVPDASGAGVGEMAQTSLAQDFNDFSYSPEVGGIAPMHGNAAARHLVHENDRLVYAVAHTYATGGTAIVYPTMLFAYRGTDYVYANIHSSPIWYTDLLNLLAG